MPVYMFVCHDCGLVTEILSSVENRPDTVPCDKCGASTQRDYRGEKAAPIYHPTRGRAK